MVRTRRQLRSRKLQTAGAHPQATGRRTRQRRRKRQHAGTFDGTTTTWSPGVHVRTETWPPRSNTQRASGFLRPSRHPRRHTLVALEEGRAQTLGGQPRSYLQRRGTPSAGTRRDRPPPRARVRRHQAGRNRSRCRPSRQTPRHSARLGRSELDSNDASNVPVTVWPGLGVRHPGVRLRHADQERERPAYCTYAAHELEHEHVPPASRTAARHDEVHRRTILSTARHSGRVRCRSRSATEPRRRGHMVQAGRVVRMDNKPVKST